MIKDQIILLSVILNVMLMRFWSHLTYEHIILILCFLWSFFGSLFFCDLVILILKILWSSSLEIMIFDFTNVMVAIRRAVKFKHKWRVRKVLKPKKPIHWVLVISPLRNKQGEERNSPRRPKERVKKLSFGEWTYDSIL